jgi:hypothetical protein
MHYRCTVIPKVPWTSLDIWSSKGRTFIGPNHFLLDHNLSAIFYSLVYSYMQAVFNFITSIFTKSNRFLHTFLGKTGWFSTSDRNFMSFREWSAAKQAKRHKNFYHEWKITRAFPTTHVSTYFFRKPTIFTIVNS